jgi:hypothetical protein
LIVVVGLVGALSIALVRGFGGGKTAALQSGQAVVANLLSAARDRAVANGTTTRLLFNQSPAGPRRYLHYLVLQEQVSSGGPWQVVTDAFLSQGVCVLPEQSNAPTGLLADPDGWITSSGGTLDSSALSVLTEEAAVAAYPDDSWSMITFSSAGAPDPPGGLIVLATARTVPPGESLPVQLLDPQNVRGVRLSRYGVPVRLNGRSEF